MNMTDSSDTEDPRDGTAQISPPSRLKRGLIWTGRLDRRESLVEEDL